MDARVEAERETADEGWPGRRKRGEDRKEGKRKSSGNPSCKSPVHCCKWGGGKKTSTSKLQRRLHLPLAACHSLYFY